MERPVEHPPGEVVEIVALEDAFIDGFSVETLPHGQVRIIFTMMGNGDMRKAMRSIIMPPEVAARLLNCRKLRLAPLGSTPNRLG
jgi:hypothetical protein